MKKLLVILLILIGINAFCYFVIKVSISWILLISAMYFLVYIVVAFFITFYKLVYFINDVFETWGG